MIAMLGLMVLLTPGLMFVMELRSGMVPPDEADFWRWLMRQPIERILLLSAMQPTGYLLLAYGTLAKIHALTGNIPP